MNEVLDENFDEVYPQLEKLVKNASFIAIDTELTGITADTEVTYSLFDSLDLRYRKLKDTIENFAIIQYGITVFHHVIDSNLYDAQCFTFYLLPRPLPFKNRQLTLEMSALEFLNRHNFDFNKLVNQGITYLHEPDEKAFKQYIKEGSLTDKLNHLSYDDESNFKECMSEVQNWIFNSPGDADLKIEVNNPLVQYLVQKEIKESYQSIHTSSGYKTITVKKVSIVDIETEDSDYLEQLLLDSYIRFSKVFKLLCSSKKPLIGHNILFDLLFTYQQFYKPLPAQYIEFKRNMHSIFPQIYDTKFLCTELRRLYTQEVYWKQSSLNKIYEFFTSKDGKYLTLNSPAVKLKCAASDVKDYHNAGWDSYIAGFIFIKVGSVFSSKKYGSGLVDRGITHSELMSGVKDFVNSINITRSNEICMKLDAKDPLYSKPEWLHVKLKSPTIDQKALIEKFSSFGQVDVMPFARKRVLVAVSNKKSALHILQHFQSSKELQVARYNRIRHAPPITICLWSGVVLSSGLFAWVVKQTLLRSS